MIQFDGNKNVVKGKIRNLSKLIHSIANDHQKTIREIVYVFTDDETLLQMNRDVLKHDYYTDIITFDYSEGNILEGEIYISTDRVKDNAKSYQAEFHVELLRVVFHGVLHMVGYKDKKPKEKTTMREQEDYYIKKYNELFHVEQK